MENKELNTAIKEYLRENLHVYVSESVLFGPKKRITVSLFLGEEKFSSDYFDMEEN